VTSSSQTPPLIEEEAPVLKHVKVWKEQKYGHGFPTWFEIKNVCAVEDQQEFTGLGCLHGFNDFLLEEAAVKETDSSQWTRDQNEEFRRGLLLQGDFFFTCFSASRLGERGRV
jgi:hypothetical protein